jgi:hypothetical protein
MARLVAGTIRFQMTEPGICPGLEGQKIHASPF